MRNMIVLLMVKLVKRNFIRGGPIFSPQVEAEVFSFFWSGSAVRVEWF